ncbi:MAG: hypothetical protein KDN20_00260 [Verrucomicrobiae bacterium]|nr:hypothetical protein [Verrucomicrobiae bacterium]
MTFDFESGTFKSEEIEAEECIPSELDSVVEPETWWDRYVPVSMRSDPELNRRARLQVRFGFLGALFGALYAAFYFLIGHNYGGIFILICSLSVAMIPRILLKFQRLGLTGHLFAAVLLVGFGGLCLVEGGMKGHAIAWLASIPLCVLLLVEQRGAIIWTVLCSVVASAFGLLHMNGVTFPTTYPEKWGPAIDAAGYAGLVPFMAILGLIFEITRRKAFDRLQKTLNELSSANERLVRLNEDKNEFLNIAAHDLKNPLSVISGYAGLIQMTDPLDPKVVKDQTKEILGSANRMLDIISNLLDTRAIEDGKLKLKAERCPFEPLVEVLVRDYANAAAAKQISVTVQGDADDVISCSDRVATHQILDNLFSNAIKYSPPGSSVSLSLRKDDSESVVIDVIDEGPGLSDQDQAKLFQKFSRLTPQPTGGESSNGLGLWIVHRMAQGMKGEVACHSKLGEGSTFSLKLPVWSGDDSDDELVGEIALVS